MLTLRMLTGAAALAKANVTRLSGPLKINLCVTYACQYRCKTCNIWQRKPTNELTTRRIALVRRREPRRVTGSTSPAARSSCARTSPTIFDAIVSSVAPSCGAALSDQRISHGSHRCRAPSDAGAGTRHDDRDREPRRRRGAERQRSRHQRRLPAADRNVPCTAAHARHSRRCSA